MLHRLILLVTIFILTSIASAQEHTLDVTVSNPQPYIGEVITYTITLTSPFDLSEAQIRTPSFIGFAQQPAGLNQSTTPSNSVILNVIEQDIILYANQIGNLLINPTTIIVPESPFQNGFEVTSNPITITVQPLPDNAPETFTGGVGQFDMSVSIEPPIVEAGEPNTVRIAITGVGNFSQISSPPLRLPDTWEVFERPPATVSAGGNIETKTFEYQFFASQTGNLDLPAVLFTFFDPLTESYRTVSDDVEAVTVEGEFPTSQTVTEQSNSSRLALKPMTDTPDSQLPPNTFWLLWLIAPLIAIFLMFTRIISRSSRTQQAKSAPKQSKPLRIVSTQLGQARQSEPNQAYRIVEQTILQYLSTRYQQEVRPSNTPDVITDLPDRIQQKVKICLEQSQTGQYAPVTREDANKLIRRTYKTIQLIEEQRR